MTLYEIGLEYEESAKLLRKKMHDIRLEIKATTNPDEIWRLRRRLAELTPMLTECNRLSVYCRRYYSRGFYINDGPFGRGGERSKASTIELSPEQEARTNNVKRTNRAPANANSRVSAKWENVRRRCERIKAEQKHNLEEL